MEQNAQGIAACCIWPWTGESAHADPIHRWAHENQNWAMEQCNKVAWSDEHHVDSFVHCLSRKELKPAGAMFWKNVCPGIYVDVRTWLQTQNRM